LRPRGALRGARAGALLADRADQARRVLRAGPDDVRHRTRAGRIRVHAALMEGREYLTVSIDRLLAYLDDSRACRRRTAATSACRLAPWHDDLPPRIESHAHHADAVVRALVTAALAQVGRPVPKPAPGAALRPAFPAAPEDRWTAIAGL